MRDVLFQPLFFKHYFHQPKLISLHQAGQRLSSRREAITSVGWRL
jgi:hypothetical protein